MKLIYVSSPYSGAVVEGQVYNLLEYYVRQGWFSDVLLLQEFHNEENRIKAESVLSRFSFRYVFYHGDVNYPFLYFSTVSSIRKALEGEVDGNSVFHVRSSIRALYVKAALPRKYKNNRFLVEFRGLSLDEIRMAHRNTVLDKLKVSMLKVPYCKYMLHKLYKNKEFYFTAVSPAFCVILKKEGIREDRLSFHPNIVSEDFVFSEDDRARVRKELGIPLDAKVAIMSSGENGVWQKDRQVMDTLLKQGYIVMNLSKKSVQRDGVKNAFIPRKEMPSYLAAGDVAVLWREDIPLNNVACPSKFGEFASSGLYVLHNKSVAIANTYLNEVWVGLLCDTEDRINLLPEYFTNEYRLKRCAKGQAFFSVCTVAKSYFEIYSRNN